MIVTDLARVREQAVLTPNMQTAIDFLVRSGRNELPLGRHPIDGDRVYAEVQGYDTLAGEIPHFEAHRAYIDIQYVASGDEIIGWASIDHGRETKPYDAEHDYWLAAVDPAHVTEVRLTSGQLAVLYPVDLHAPRRAAGASSPVRKLVVKVAIEY
jgi:biofilm protein TabA